VERLISLERTCCAEPAGGAETDGVAAEIVADKTKAVFCCSEYRKLNLFQFVGFWSGLLLSCL